MTYNTLKIIENLLQKEVSMRNLNLKRVTEKVNQLYQDEEDCKPDFDPEDLESWKRQKNCLADYATEARDALHDFLTHDWR